MKKLLLGLLSLVLCASLTACGTSTGNEEPVVENEKAELVIVGAGAAGMSAAIKAADKGVNVVLLEKMAFPGGASIMASAGINAGSAELQLATEEVYTADMFYDYAKSWDYGYDRIGYRVTPVRDDYAYTFAYESADAANWIASLGLEMKASSNSHSIQLITKENGVFGVLYVAALKEKLAEYENIELRTENKATEVVLDENGAVAGIKVENKEGTYTIDTTAVILATGGYASADSDFWATYAPEWDGFYSTGAASATGDGIVIADALGAKIEGMEAVTCTSLTVGTANKAGAYGLKDAHKNGAILVNKEGTRFVNEVAKTAPMMEGIKAQTDKEAYLIVDETLFQASNDWQKFSEMGVVVSAATLEELAKALEMDAEILSATVTTFVDNVKAGTDEFEITELGTDYAAGNYYAVLVKPAKRIATGGIVTTGKAEVLNANDEVITGLYAAGETTSYGAHPLSAATIFGRKSADSVVEFLGK